MRSIVEAVANPVIRFASRSYVSGETLEDAVRLAQTARQQGYSCTLCYWNDGKEAPVAVAAKYRATVDAIAQAGLDGWVAVKTPALQDSVPLAAGVVAHARAAGVRVMFDSHSPSQADDVWRVIDAVGPENVGCAIPGRWLRSAADADRACAAGLQIRVVKGQWADPAAPDIDLRDGYRAIIARVAGRAARVSVATHDAGLADESIAALQAAGTPCIQEVVYPDPLSKAVAVAEARGVESRLYIPYGTAWLPYSVSRAFRKPEVVGWFLRDLLTDNRFKMPARRPHTCLTDGP